MGHPDRDSLSGNPLRQAPGHIRNAFTSFRFPVMYRIVKGATAVRVVLEADNEATINYQYVNSIDKAYRCSHGNKRR